jgi:hypothetical protein
VSAALSALRDRLEAAREQGSVPFDADTLGDSGTSVVALFSAELGVDSVTLSADATITLDDPGTHLTVSGDSTGPLLGIDEPPVTAVFTADESGGDTVLQVALTIDAGHEWSLATTFPHLAGTALGKLTFPSDAAPRLTLRSVDADPDAYGPTEPAGLSLELDVEVDPSGPLGVLAPVLALTVGATLRMKGPVSVSDDAESIALRASSGVPSVGFDVLGLDTIGFGDSMVVVEGRSRKGVDDQWGSSADVAMWGLVSVGGSRIPMGIAAPLGMGSWRLFVVPDQGVRLLQVVEFVPGLSIVEALPSDVRNVVDAPVDTFSMTLGEGSGSWTPRALQVIVRTDEPWALLPGVLELDAITVALRVAFSGPTVHGGVSGTVTLGSGDGAVPIDVVVPIPLDDGPITLSSTPNTTLPGLGALAGWVGGESVADQLPAGIGDIGSFTLFSLFASIDGTKRTLQSASVSLGAKRWTVIPDHLDLDDIQLDLRSDATSDGTVLTGQIGGTFSFDGTASIAVSALRFEAADDWKLSVLANNVPLPNLNDLGTLTGIDLRTVVPAGIADNRFEIASLAIDANLSKGSMERIALVVDSKDVWPIVPDQFQVEQVVAKLTLDWRSGQLATSGLLSAVLDLSPGHGGTPDGQVPQGHDDDVVQLRFTAARATDGDWALSGSLEHPVDLVRLVQIALGEQPSTEYGSVDLDVLDASYHTSTGAYAFEVAGGWRLELDDLTLALTADVALQRAPAKKEGGGDQPAYLYSGQLSGALASHFGAHDLDLSVAYVFQQQDQTSFVFTFTFDGVGVACTYTRRTDGDSVLRGRLTGVTFGDLVEFLVNLVDPSLHFKLSAPWDVLNKIRFDDFELVMNLTQRTIGMRYHVGTNLGIVDVETVGLTFLHKGGSATVDIEITGSFVGEQYPPERPLSWDLLNDAPPTSPGGGEQLFDLQTLGVGQHLTLADPDAKTVPAVMSDLHEIVAQTQDAKKPWEIVTFDSNAGWLIGAQFTVMDTVGLSLIFNDPVLYGARITLDGPKAGTFAGLDFEVLYRKVSDDVGVYHIALKLPDMMRHLEFGEVSVTLPVVVVDIYTDGGFMVDFGFPHDNDWSVCFGLEIFPFLGSGGLYLGRLTAAGRRRRRRAGHQQRDLRPVVEFGFALAVGVGKEIKEGPLSAGLSLTVQGVLEASWPGSTRRTTRCRATRYYRVSGSVATVGKLYGKVDFKVISVSVSVVASVTATMVIEAYAPIHMGLSVDVSVRASIKILFVRLHFSFSMQPRRHLHGRARSADTLDARLGQRRRRPGPVHAGVAARRAEPPPPGRRQVAAGARRRADAAARLATCHGARGATAVLDLTMLPVLTVSQPPGEDAAVAIVMVPFAQTGAAPAAADAHQLRRSLQAPRAAAPAALPFDVLVEALLKWGMQTLLGTHSGDITAVDLDLIYEDLCAETIGAGGFAYDNVAAFVAANMVLALRAPASGSADMSGAALPMMPPLRMRPDGQPPVDFSDTPQVSAAYQEALSKVFAQLQVNYDYDRAADPDGEDPGPGRPHPPTTTANPSRWRCSATGSCWSPSRRCRRAGTPSGASPTPWRRATAWPTSRPATTPPWPTRSGPATRALRSRRCSA